MSTTENDNACGYANPPKAHRFKPGQSGNPNGRPKGSKNMDKGIIEMMEETVSLKVNGEPMELSAGLAKFKVQQIKALKGDRLATELCFAKYERALAKAEALDAGRTARALTGADKTSFEALKKRILASLDVKKPKAKARQRSKAVPKKSKKSNSAAKANKKPDPNVRLETGADNVGR